jgi:hypothetical protein
MGRHYSRLAVTELRGVLKGRAAIGKAAALWTALCNRVRLSRIKARKSAKQGGNDTGPDHVKHYGKQVHWDGANDVDAVLLIAGDGPATTTPFVSADELK